MNCPDVAALAIMVIGLLGFPCALFAYIVWRYTRE